MCWHRLVTKTSVMLGLGEKPEEVRQTMVDLRNVGVDIVTFGQYLRPSRRHMKVEAYVHPNEFDAYKTIGEELGDENSKANASRNVKERPTALMVLTPCVTIVLSM